MATSNNAAAAMPTFSQEALLQCMFHAADTNNDGSLSRAELNKLLVLCDYSLPWQDFEDIFTTIDSDNNGSIDLEEFESVMSTSLSPKKHAISISLDKVFKVMFKFADTDGDGTLSRKELNKLLVKCGYTLSWEDFEEMYTTVDTDNSGSIDLDEFSRAMTISSEKHNAAMNRDVQD